MIRVRAIDSFLYKGIHVGTGNKVMVEKSDIPKLVAAKKISPEYLETPQVEPVTPKIRFSKKQKKSGRKRKMY